MLLQQRKARSSIMVNIYCRMHSYYHLNSYLSCQHKQYYFFQTTLCCISEASLVFPVFLLPSAFPFSTTCANPGRGSAGQTCVQHFGTMAVAKAERHQRLLTFILPTLHKAKVFGCRQNPAQGFE